jgi:hypothetical protein
VEQTTNSGGRRIRQVMMTATVLALAALAGVPALAAVPAGAGAEVEAPALRTILRAADVPGRSLAAEDRSEIEEALRQRAWDGGVVICADHSALPAAAQFTEACRAPGPEVMPLWWDLQVTLPRSGRSAVATATLRIALGNSPPKKDAPELFLFGPLVLPAGTPGDGHRAARLAVAAALRSSTPLLAWFRRLAVRPGLLRLSAEPPAPSASEVQEWSRQVLQVADLVIDGKLEAAIEEADCLLLEPRLPVDLVVRTRDLKDRAAAKLASAPPPAAGKAAPATVAAGKATAAGKKTVPAPAVAAGKTEPAPAAERTDSVFTVRPAIAGVGFGGEAAAQLRLSKDGISLHRAGRGAAEWSVSWAELTSLALDGGLWESPYTLVLAARGGRKHYFSLLDGRGHYASGAPLLAAVAARQTAFRRAHGGGGAAETTPGEQP